ncbi:acyl-CoA dehydrogenase [Acrocarpospora pleiomorpha]|uniref:Acyl-CoA dehydrogenase n=1 Tax=Acrocarpospora pleiomorpha TaxID=90975 RepID=A0A5M3Y1Y7_9ACTN|nr:acyl-CoA dehydrogenase family protein [Acrocarpospora pleiomorpha]GES25781.1 acyl-CoA dehydrogenase [Acrocarpospora pleiomorpha]
MSTTPSGLMVTEDEATVAQVVEEFIRVHDDLPTSRTRIEDGAPYPRSTWTRAARELGLAGVASPEHLGGAGLGFRGLCVVMESVGRHLALAPLLPTVAMAVPALLACGPTSAATDLLGRIHDGTTLTTLVLGTACAPFVSQTKLRAVEDGTAPGAFRVSGTVSYVVGAADADVLLVIAQHRGIDRLFAVDPSAAAVQVRPLDTLDLTRAAAAVALSDVPAKLISAAADAFPTRQVLAIASIAHSCEQVGAASRSLDRAVGYAGLRVQFGRAIGSFQAVKHRCVDMLVELEGARSAVYHARRCTGQDADQLTTAASLAKVRASTALTSIATSALHVHGGLGFTWEDDSHLYLRRAKSSAAYLGQPHRHLEWLASELLGDEPGRDDIGEAS